MKIDPFDPESLRKNLRQRAIRGGAVTIASQAVLFAIQFVGSVLMARILSPNDFGLVGMVMAVVGFLNTFKDLGLSLATIQEPQITRQQVSWLFWFNVFAGLAMTLVTLALAPFLVWFYGRPELFYITIALSVGFVISGSSAQQKALLERTMSFSRIASIDITTVVIGFAAGLTAAICGMGYWSVVIQQLVRAIVSSIGFWIGAGWRPGFFPWDPSVKSMLRFGGFSALNSLVNYASRNVDNIAIGWKWGAGPLGLYSRAYSLLTMPLSQISGPIAQVAIPALSRLRNEQLRMREVFLALMGTVGFILIPPIAVLMACSEPVIALLLGPKWAQVAIIYRWLGFAALTEPMTTLCGILFLIQGRSKEMAHSSLINSAISVASILVALPWGPVAVAASYSAVGLFVRAPIVFHFAAKMGVVSRYDLFVTVVPRVLLGGLIFAADYYILHVLRLTNNWWQIVVGAAIGGAIFLVVLVFSSTQRASLAWLVSIFKNRRNSDKMMTTDRS